MKTIHELRKEGYKIRIQHYRRIPPCDPSKPDSTFSSLETEKALRNRGCDLWTRGGATVMTFQTPGEKPIQVQAVCSTADNFSHKRGVQLCLYRAFGYAKTQERILKKA